jgi:hypothetical protein
MATRYLPTPLGNAFFSDFNRESIHSALTSDVQGKTGYIIDRQSDSDLQAIMKSVYMRMAYDEYQDIRGQVGKMNAAVVSEASRMVMTGVLQQLVYMKDIGSNPVPLAAPVSTSTYGDKIPINNRYGM